MTLRILRLKVWVKVAVINPTKISRSNRFQKNLSNLAPKHKNLPIVKMVRIVGASLDANLAKKFQLRSL